MEFVVGEELDGGTTIVKNENDLLVLGYGFWKTKGNERGEIVCWVSKVLTICLFIVLRESFESFYLLLLLF